MEKATISEVKNNLSAYLKKVKKGESVLILDRRQPIARLERIEQRDHPQARLTELEREGLLRHTDKPLPLALLRRPPPGSREGVLQALLDERAEGR